MTASSTPLPQTGSASEPTRGRAPLSGSRRDLLKGACAVVAGLSMAGPARADGSTKAKGLIDATARVTAGRLDAMVAEAFPHFNRPVILPAFDSRKHGARYDVDLHRLVTTTTVPETGEAVKISGLLALPVGVSGPLPVLSWQHGTILSFDQVPSNMVLLADPAYRMTDEKDSLETLFNIQRFAAQGYAVIAADYLGKGPFRAGRGEAYAVKDATVRTCLDILEVGLEAMKSLKAEPGRLFLNGWSQGALNTQWLHQELRRQSRVITASAVQSPFNDLTESWRYWAGAQTFPPLEGAKDYPAAPNWISLCMIIALGSYQQYYGLDGLIKSATRPEFHDLALKYWADYALDFDRSKPFPTGETLLVPGFFDRFTDDRNSAFLRQIGLNIANVQRYDAPIRFYYGLADEAIRPAMSRRALAAGGRFASGAAVAGASHRGTFLASLYGDGSALDGQENVVDWFASLNK